MATFTNGLSAVMSVSSFPPSSSTSSAKASGASDQSGQAAQKSTSHSHTGAIIGGVVGGILGLALIGALFFFFVTRSRRSRQPHVYEAPPGHVNEAAGAPRYEAAEGAKHEMYAGTDLHGNMIKHNYRRSVEGPGPQPMVAPHELA